MDFMGHLLTARGDGKVAAAYAQPRWSGTSIN